MPCAEFETLIEEHVDGELSSSGSADLEGHLAACGRCLKRFDEIQELRQLLREVGTTDRWEPETLRAPRPVRATDFRALPGARGADSRLLWSRAAAAVVLGLALVGIANGLRQESPHHVAQRRVPGPVFELETPANSSLLAVNLPSRHEDVHIVWLYEVEPQKGTPR